MTTWRRLATWPTNFYKITNWLANQLNHQLVNGLTHLMTYRCLQVPTRSGCVLILEFHLLEVFVEIPHFLLLMAVLYGTT